MMILIMLTHHPVFLGNHSVRAASRQEIDVVDLNSVFDGVLHVGIDVGHDFLTVDFPQLVGKVRQGDFRALPLLVVV